jgi:hypothetical protein
MFEQLLKDTISAVLADDPDASVDFEKFLADKGWPMGYDKSSFRGSINLLINESLPDDPEGTLLDLMLGRTRVPIEVTAPQKAAFEKIIKVTDASPQKTCPHENMGIAPFMHGGGFSPVMQAVPEVICRDCGLNVTLYLPKDMMDFEKRLGIATTKKKIEELHTWANSCERTDSANNILRDPISAFNRSKYKWEGKLPFSIINKKKFDAMSGK